ncbi:Glycosyltransferase like family 2 [Hymenobacter daecheongensis DSM 21074]|uniref:Glycosyltransferase like family 2 n=1 Tax=Hymenobacter daecheongensis DSM 21074 TaxID=1121955 RepID=A0A1M6MKZ5_9BACT|nr:glycosyltransferase [Hymenobacter daecheongensis]SHJ84050.1 Glycosyltransferase like family 2 [Hymenobacter daecheongensis DSM 21074]
MDHVSPLRFHAAQEATAALVLADTWRIATLPRPALQAAIIIPVKDEAENLPHTLAALAAQTDLAGQPLPPDSYEIIVLANNCHDQTAAVARRFAAAHPHLALHVGEITLPPAQAHVGRARRLLMDEACRRLELVPATEGVILSTDGDTRVAPTWVAATLAEISTHQAEAVGGRILTPQANDRPAERRYHLRDTAYRLLRARLESLIDPNPADPWPRHHQHFGASFAITARAYRRVGGLPEVAYLEDEALYQALCRHDLRVRHSPAVRVFTSDRHEGRVEVGLSWQLRQWSALHEQQREPMVEGAAQLLAGWQDRRALRQFWQQTLLSSAPAQTLPSELTVPILAERLGISIVLLAQRLRQMAAFGELWAWVQQEQDQAGRSQRWPLVPLSCAVAELRQQVACHESRQAVPVS